MPAVRDPHPPPSGCRRPGACSCRTCRWRSWRTASARSWEHGERDDRLRGERHCSLELRLPQLAQPDVPGRVVGAEVGLVERAPAPLGEGLRRGGLARARAVGRAQEAPERQGQAGRRAPRVRPRARSAAGRAKPSAPRPTAPRRAAPPVGPSPKADHGAGPGASRHQAVQVGGEVPQAARRASVVGRRGAGEGRCQGEREPPEGASTRDGRPAGLASGRLQLSGLPHARFAGGRADATDPGSAAAIGGRRLTVGQKCSRPPPVTAPHAGPVSARRTRAAGTRRSPSGRGCPGRCGAGPGSCQ